MNRQGAKNAKNAKKRQFIALAPLGVLAVSNHFINRVAEP
jgi:hypothetical protein